MQLLGVGVATLDIIDTLADYPREDSEQRALSRRSALGGNAANTLGVLSQFGHGCSWAGTLADDPASEQIAAGLQARGIDTQWARRHAGGASPVSHILLSLRTASRTIVHYRDLPEFEADDFAAIDLAPFQWVHFEGRHVPACLRMLRRVRESCPRLTISLEVEKPREGIERLFAHADVLLFSRAYVESLGHADPGELFGRLRGEGVKGLLFAAWGDAGGWLDDGRSPAEHRPARPPPRLVDTLGAGDVFNAGLIHGLLTGDSPQRALERAIALAGRKCGQIGFDGLVKGDE